MKSSITNRPLVHGKLFNVILLVLILCVGLPHVVYAGWTKTWDAASGRMEITITDGDNVTITKHPIMGTLAVNGQCTGVPADSVKKLVILGDSGNNIIDLKAMKKADFPLLEYTGKNKINLKVVVVANAGNDKVYGSDLGNYINGGKGNDELHTGSLPDVIEGCEGFDNIKGDKKDFELNGGADIDYVEVAGKVTIGKRLDIDTKDNHLKNHLSQSNHLMITDSSGIDSLNFADFDSSIVIDLDLFNEPQIYTENEDTLSLYGIFEHFIGTQFDDVIHIDPDSDVPRYVNGGGSYGADTLYVDAMEKEATDDGQTVTIQDYQPITYENFDCCVITNQPDSYVGREGIDSLGKFQLHQNYPNPFNPVTVIPYGLHQSNFVSLKIFNLTGQEIETLINEYQTPGNHHIKWTAEGYPSGFYFYNLQVGEQSVTKKLILKK